MKSSNEAVDLINGSGIVRELITNKGVRCFSCGLPRNAAGKLMAVPGLAGQFCSVLCAEQGIYERGCRWCGERTEKESDKFCSEECKHKASITQFGNGRRLYEWLRRHGVYEELQNLEVAA